MEPLPCTFSQSRFQLVPNGLLPRRTKRQLRPRHSRNKSLSSYAGPENNAPGQINLSDKVRSVFPGNRASTRPTERSQRRIRPERSRLQSFHSMPVLIRLPLKSGVQQDQPNEANGESDPGPHGSRALHSMPDLIRLPMKSGVQQGKPNEANAPLPKPPTDLWQLPKLLPTCKHNAQVVFPFSVCLKRKRSQKSLAVHGHPHAKPHPLQ